MTEREVEEVKRLNGDLIKVFGRMVVSSTKLVYLFQTAHRELIKLASAVDEAVILGDLIDEHHNPQDEDPEPEAGDA